MTLRELAIETDAFFWREDRWMRALSACTAAVANYTFKSKKKLKPEDLYKPRYRERHVLTQEEHARRFREAVKRMGPEAIPVKRRVRKATQGGAPSDVDA